MKRFIVNKFFVPKGFAGITLYPFVFTNNPQLLEDPQFINHERIHLAQQRELLVIFFYIWYLIDFGITKINIAPIAISSLNAKPTKMMTTSTT